jgi:hypothetical protein
VPSAIRGAPACVEAPVKCRIIQGHGLDVVPSFAGDGNGAIQLIAPAGQLEVRLDLWHVTPPCTA